MKIEDLERRLTGTFTGVCGDRAGRVAVVAGITEVKGQKPLLVLEKSDGSVGLTELEGGTFFPTREACDAAIEAEIAAAKKKLDAKSNGAPKRAARAKKQRA